MISVRGKETDIQKLSNLLNAMFYNVERRKERIPNTYISNHWTGKK